MPSFTRSIDIDASPDEVWQLIGDIGSVIDWIPGVVGVTVNGMNRVCSFDDGHQQDEHILDYSPETHSYRYHIEGAPLPVTDNAGRFSVEALGERARLTWESSFRPVDPAMERQLAEMWEPYLPMVLAKVKELVEG